ncbi:hypothetical protein ASE73_01640 [Sphingomonas sp. Leaf24]|uniref:hypothetical protein n=1 Tax=unclassified Sphingomonas TaxID=196159 RepID=UPI0006FC937C|nr:MULTISPECIES: hypothetical protein [unclassified Sphingomonas]KQM22960.1 hypothetical protein ASE50_01640 [Sphingomonas sp. Leaf5]KQM95817.1 hypothetical protein ASE73_01640 [Sphingomonas sp. Leaf24]
MAAPKPEPRRHSLFAIGLFVLVVFQGVKVDLPDVVTLPIAVDTTQGIAFAARLGDAAISLTWR